MFRSDFSVGDLEPELKSIYFLWHSACGAGLYQRLMDFGLPSAECAPDILSIYEIERSSIGGNGRLFGTLARSRLCNTLRDKFVGTRLSEHPGFGPGSMMWSCFAEAAANPQPLLVSLPYVGPLPGYPQHIRDLPSFAGGGRQGRLSSDWCCPFGSRVCPSATGRVMKSSNLGR